MPLTDDSACSSDLSHQNESFEKLFLMGSACMHAYYQEPKKMVVI